MASPHYCWRCKIEVPMLDEDEWLQLAPLLHRSLQDLKDYREKHGASLKEAFAETGVIGASALAKYRELTGFDETNVNALWHHRRSLYGPLCKHCGKLVRTDRARWCAECGAET